MDSVLTSLRCGLQRVAIDYCVQFLLNSPPSTNSVGPANAIDVHCIDWRSTIEKRKSTNWNWRRNAIKYSPVFGWCLVSCTSYINITACIAAMVVAQRRWSTGRQTTRRSVRRTQIFRTRVQRSISLLSGWSSRWWCIPLVCRGIFGQRTFRWRPLTIFTICPIPSVRVCIVCCVASTCRHIMTIFDSAFDEIKLNSFGVPMEWLCNLCQIEKTYFLTVLSCALPIFGSLISFRFILMFSIGSSHTSIYLDWFESFN